MRHPFELIPPELRLRVFLFLFVPTAVIGTWLYSVGRDLATEAVPQGMLALQLAGDPLVANDIVVRWGPEQLVAARLSLGLDYAFLLCYSTTLAFGCVWASRLFSDSLLARVGSYVAWGQWIAALFDAVENYALLRVLPMGLSLGVERFTPDGFFTSLARICSLTKFILIVVGLWYIALAGFYHGAGARLKSALAWGK